MWFNWKSIMHWMYGLLAALIGGGASAVTSSITASMLAPNSFNLHDQRDALVALVYWTFTINGALTAFAYLAKEPLPPWDGETERRQ